MCVCVCVCACIFMRSTASDVAARGLGTGWRRLIRSPKLQIIFHNRATKYRALLLKMTYKDKGSYESSPPCTITFVAINIAAKRLDSLMRQRGRESVCVCACICVCAMACNSYRHSYCSKET